MSVSLRMQMPCAGACAHRLSLPRSAIHRAPLQKAFLGGSSSLCSTRSTFAGKSTVLIWQYGRLLIYKSSPGQVS